MLILATFYSSMLPWSFELMLFLNTFMLQIFLTILLSVHRSRPCPFVLWWLFVFWKVGLCWDTSSCCTELSAASLAKAREIFSCSLLLPLSLPWVVVGQQQNHHRIFSWGRTAWLHSALTSLDCTSVILQSSLGRRRQWQICRYIAVLVQ